VLAVATVLALTLTMAVIAILLYSAFDEIKTGNRN
jgi:hypothetical protein